MPPINRNKVVPLQGDMKIKIPYEFSLECSTSKYTTDLTRMSRQVDIYKTDKAGDERATLIDACIDLILDSKQELIRTTEDDFLAHESIKDFPVIPFDERTLRCTTFTKGKEEVEVNIQFCAFSVPFPVTV